MGQAAPVTIPVPAFTVTPAACQSSVTLNWQLDQAYSFAKLDIATNSINVMTQDISLIGTQKIGLTAMVQFSPTLTLDPASLEKV